MKLSILPRGSAAGTQQARLPKSFICFLRRRTCCFIMSLFRHPLTHRSQWQFKKGQWCLWPLRFDRTPWLLQSVHEGLRSFLTPINFSRDVSSIFLGRKVKPKWVFSKATPSNTQALSKTTANRVEWDESLGGACIVHWQMPVKSKNSNCDWAKWSVPVHTTCLKIIAVLICLFLFSHNF